MEPNNNKDIAWNTAVFIPGKRMNIHHRPQKIVYPCTFLTCMKKYVELWKHQIMTLKEREREQQQRQQHHKNGGWGRGWWRKARLGRKIPTNYKWLILPLMGKLELSDFMRYASISVVQPWAEKKIMYSLIPLFLLIVITIIIFLRAVSR